MLFRKTEHKRTHPYVAMTIGTLAMVGAINIVRCTKRSVRCMREKITGMFKSADEDGCPME